MSNTLSNGRCNRTSNHWSNQGGIERQTIGQVGGGTEHRTIGRAGGGIERRTVGQAGGRTECRTGERKIFAQLFNKIGEYDGLLFVNNLNGVTVADKEKIMKLPGKWQDKYCYLMQMWKEKITSLDWKFELVSALDAIERPDVIKDLFPNYLTKSSGIEGMPFQRKSIQDEINGQTSQYHDEPTLMEKTLRREKYEENIKDEVPVRVILHKEKKEEKCPSKRDSGRERDNLFWISQMGQTVPTLMDRTLNREYEKNTMDEFPGRVDLLEEKKKEKCPSKHESDPEQNNSFWLFQTECSDFREVCEKLSNKQAVDLLKKLGIEHEIIKDEKKLKRMKDGRKLFSNILQNWLFMNERTQMLADALVSINRLDLVKDLFPSRDFTVGTPPAIENINEVVLTSQSQLDPDKVFEKELVSEQMLRKLGCKLRKKESSLIYKKLGLQRQDIENVMKVHSNRPLNERVYHCLMKWKLKAINSNADEVLARALWSIGRKDLINEIFPEQKILKLVANQLDKNDAIALINKMDLKREVMQSITWDTQKKYQILRKWWQKVDDNEWDYILVGALLSINRQELVKDLFPERHFFMQIINRIGKDEGPFLFEKLNEISDEEIKHEMDQPGTWHIKYCNLLQAWKEKISPLDWKSNLVHALVAINRQDIIKLFFPDYMYKLLPSGNVVKTISR